MSTHRAYKKLKEILSKNELPDIRFHDLRHTFTTHALTSGVDAFGEAKREREITDYIILLTQEVKAISDSLRNPAAHSETMKCQKAEACGYYIIKVQKLLISFLQKIY